MKRIFFEYLAHPLGPHDGPIGRYIGDDQDPREELIGEVMGQMRKYIQVTIGDVTVPLGALMHPDHNHWKLEWVAQGIEDVDEFFEGVLEDDGLGEYGEAEGDIPDEED
jgi:hypothetical protein